MPQANPFPERGQAAAVLHPDRVRATRLAVQVDLHVVNGERLRLAPEDGALARLGFVEPLLALFGLFTLHDFLRDRPTAVRARPDSTAEHVPALAAGGQLDFALVDAVDRSMLVNAVGIVQDQTVGLLGVRPEPTADHLDVEALRERRPQQDDGVHSLGVEPFGIDVHVADCVIPALLERLGDPVPLPVGRGGRHDGRFKSVFPQFVGHPAAVLHVHAEEDDRLAAFGDDDLHRRPDRAGHHVGLVHRFGQARGDVIPAGVPLHLVEIGLHVADLRAQAAQEPLCYQRADVGLVAHLLQHVGLVANRAASHSVGRGGESDHAQVWVDLPAPINEMAVFPFTLGRYPVGLVDDEQIPCGEVAPFVPHAVDRGEDDRVLVVAPAEPGGVDSDVPGRPECDEFIGVLRDEFLAVRQDAHAQGRVLDLPFLYGPRHHHRLAATGRDHDQRCRVELPHVCVERGNRFFLIWPRFDRAVAWRSWGEEGHWYCTLTITFA